MKLVSPHSQQGACLRRWRQARSQLPWLRLMHVQVEQVIRRLLLQPMLLLCRRLLPPLSGGDLLRHRCRLLWLRRQIPLIAFMGWASVLEQSLVLWNRALSSSISLLAMTTSLYNQKRRKHIYKNYGIQIKRLDIFIYVEVCDCEQ